MISIMSAEHYRESNTLLREGTVDRLLTDIEDAIKESVNSGGTYCAHQLPARYQGEGGVADMVVAELRDKGYKLSHFDYSDQVELEIMW